MAQIATRTTGEALALKAVLFDKDGTLVDYFGPWLPRAARAIDAVETNYPAIGPELRDSLGIDRSGALTRLGTLGSLPLQDTIARLGSIFDRAGVSQDRRASTQSYLRHMLAFPRSRVPQPIVDIGELFDALHRMGLTVGVITNDTEETGREQLKRLGVYDKLDYYSGYREGQPYKPDPRTMFRFCDEHDIAPESVAYVGDSRVDMEMAVRAGAALAIGVLTGVGVEDTLLPFASVILDSIADLLPFLEEKYGEALTAGTEAGF